MLESKDYAWRSAGLIGCTEMESYVNVWSLHIIGAAYIYIKLRYQAGR